MLLSQVGVALALKSWAPYTSLGVLLFGCFFSSITMPLFILADIEQVLIIPNRPLEVSHLSLWFLLLITTPGYQRI